MNRSIHSETQQNRSSKKQLTGTNNTLNQKSSGPVNRPPASPLLTQKKTLETNTNTNEKRFSIYGDTQKNKQDAAKVNVSQPNFRKVPTRSSANINGSNRSSVILGDKRRSRITSVSQAQVNLFNSNNDFPPIIPNNENPKELVKPVEISTQDFKQDLINTTKNFLIGWLIANAAFEKFAKKINQATPLIKSYQHNKHKPEIAFFNLLDNEKECVPLKVQLLFALLPKPEMLDLLKSAAMNYIRDQDTLTQKQSNKIDVAINFFYTKVCYHLPSKITNNECYLNGLKFKWNEVNEIKKGRFGKIYAVEFSNKTQAVLKANDESLTDSIHEILLHAKITGHKNIIGLLGTFQQNGTWMIGLEYAPKGNLKEYLAKNPTGVDRLKIFKGILNGKLHMHTRRITHMDLKLENILIGEDGEPKICDFGASIPSLECRLPKEKLTSDNPFILAPEIGRQINMILTMQGNIMQDYRNSLNAVYDAKPADVSFKDWEAKKAETFKEINAQKDAALANIDQTITVTHHADIWSLGLILYMLKYNRQPDLIEDAVDHADMYKRLEKFAADDNNRIIAKPKIEFGHVNPLDHLNRLINCMMYPNPAMRPELQDVLDVIDLVWTEETFGIHEVHI